MRLTNNNKENTCNEYETKANKQFASSFSYSHHKIYENKFFFILPKKIIYNDKKYEEYFEVSPFPSNILMYIIVTFILSFFSPFIVIHIYISIPFASLKHLRIYTNLSRLSACLNVCLMYVCELSSCLNIF